MIENAKVWQRVNQILKSGTSGYQDEAEYDSDAESTFLEILNLLCDNYEKNQKVSDLMNKSGLIVTLPANTAADGSLNFPANHYRTFSFTRTVGPVDKPMYKINGNSIGMTSTSPIRRLTNDRSGYCFENGKMVVIPKIAMPVKLRYCKLPSMPKLVLINDNEDYQTVGTGTTDIDLPINLFNMFVYMMVQRAGIEMKEELSISYAELGLNKETI